MKLPGFLQKPFMYGCLFLGIFLLISYFTFDWLIMPFIAGKFRGVVSVPTLIGLSPEEAQSQLKPKSLVYMQDTVAENSQEVAAGLILSQFPESASRVKKGRRVWTKISKGPKSSAIPDIRGLSLRQAEIMLQQAGLILGEVESIQSGDVPDGAVIGSIPVAETEVARGTVVKIKLSGIHRVTQTAVPQLQGLTLSEAKEKLASCGLKVGELSYKSNRKTLPQTVLDQNPAAGKEAPTGEVKLVLSKD